MSVTAVKLNSTETIRLTECKSSMTEKDVFEKTAE